MNDDYKEVYFAYCETCVNYKHEPDPDDDNIDVCNECLNEPYRLYSHKPMNYKPVE